MSENVKELIAEAVSALLDQSVMGRDLPRDVFSRLTRALYASQAETGTEWGIEWSDSRPDHSEVYGGFDSYAAASYDLHESDLHGSIVSRKCTYGPWVAAAATTGFTE